jgi:glycosyltransferase involved in cell wall biosynthesis
MIKIVMLSVGPISHFKEDSLTRISNHFDGALISSSFDDEIIKIKKCGKFDLYINKFDRNRKFLSNLKFLIFAVKICVKLKIKKNRYDLVTTYDPLKSGAIGLLCAKILGCKLAVEVNGLYDSKFEYIDDQNKILGKIKRIAVLLIENIVLTLSDGVKLLYEKQIDNLHCKPFVKYIDSFPCHIETDKFHNIIDNDNEILFVGFPFFRKGVDVLISAFKLIANEYPGWHLKILGWFPNDHLLKKHIDNHPQIFHHLPVPYTEMPEHIGKCSILVLPSRSEGMGRVLVEAMASRKAVIGSNIDGIPYVISNKYDGLLFQSECSHDLADKLKILINNRALRELYGERGKIKSDMVFSEVLYFKNLLKFYRNILEK